jgi:hypothetical protein
LGKLHNVGIQSWFVRSLRKEWSAIWTVNTGEGEEEEAIWTVNNIRRWKESFNVPIPVKKFGVCDVYATARSSIQNPDRFTTSIEMSRSISVRVYLSSPSIPLKVLRSSWYWLRSGRRCLDFSLRFRSHGLNPFWWLSHGYVHIYGPFLRELSPDCDMWFDRRSTSRHVIWSEVREGTCDLRSVEHAKTQFP